jgi:hypothetical protein
MFGIERSIIVKKTFQPPLFGEATVFGQQDPTFFGAARGECPVGKPACGSDSVVTGCT